MGKGSAVSWPVGLGAKGNEGVAGVVLQNKYSVGYIELAYAIIQKMSYASVKNSAGNFVEPSLDSTAAAAAAIAPYLPRGDESWETVSITDPPGAESYPIASYTYLLVYKEQTDETKGKALVDFLWWAIHEGQQYSSALQYVPLPEEVVKLNEETLRSITYKGQPVLQDPKTAIQL